MRASGTVRRAISDTVPVMTGYIVLGVGFGILLSTKAGHNALWALAMAVIIYSGTMQYVAIDLFTSNLTLGACAAASFMLSARHLFYGISMVSRYKNIHGLKKFYMIYALTDETYSLVCSSDDENYCFWVSLLNHSYWVTGCLIGGLLGGMIRFDTKGIDFVLTALFVSICAEQWLSSENHIPALTGLTASIISLIIFGPDNFLIPSMIIITLALFALKGKLEDV